MGLFVWTAIKAKCPMCAMPAKILSFHLFVLNSVFQIKPTGITLRTCKRFCCQKIIPIVHQSPCWILNWSVLMSPAKPEKLPRKLPWIKLNLLRCSLTGGMKLILHWKSVAHRWPRMTKFIKSMQNIGLLCNQSGFIQLTTDIYSYMYIFNLYYLHSLLYLKRAIKTP